jgi:hypothetical protein
MIAEVLSTKQSGSPLFFFIKPLSNKACLIEFDKRSSKHSTFTVFSNDSPREERDSADDDSTNEQFQHHHHQKPGNQILHFQTIQVEYISQALHFSLMRDLLTMNNPQNASPTFEQIDRHPLPPQPKSSSLTVATQTKSHSYAHALRFPSSNRWTTRRIDLSDGRKKLRVNRTSKIRVAIHPIFECVRPNQTNRKRIKLHSRKTKEL